MAFKRQKALIDFLINQFQSYDGVRAMYLKGSLATETDDNYSDVDFYCYVHESIYETLLAERVEILEKFRPILYLEHVNFKDPQVIAIYDNDLHLDFYISKELPHQETIKVLYDPELLLKDVVVTREDDVNSLSKRLKEIVYTYHELYIAVQRQDDLWTTRLISHILADMSLILDQVYPSNRPVLHMKSVYQKLPAKYQHTFDAIFKSLHPKDALACMRQLIELTVELSKDFDISLDHQYLEMMKEKVKPSITIEPYTLEACHEVYRQYVSDPQMVDERYTYDENKVTQYFYTKSEETHRHMFSIHVDNHIIGEIQLKYIDEVKKEGTLSIILAHDAYKNKGYGTAAERLIIDYGFNVLRLDTIFADTTSRNLRSKKVLEKLGFKWIKSENEMDYFQLKASYYSS